MFDSLLTHALMSFEDHEWSALVQDIRQFLSQAIIPSGPEASILSKAPVQRSTSVNGQSNGQVQVIQEPTHKSSSRPHTPSTVAEPDWTTTNTMIRLGVQALSHVEFQVRWELVPLIAKFGPAAIPHLTHVLDNFQVDTLTDDSTPTSDSPQSPVATKMSGYSGMEDEENEDWDLLWFISRILGEIQHPDAIAALIQVLQTSPSEDVVTAAVMALAQQGVAAIAPLRQLLGHSATKLVATQALARIFAKDPTSDLRTVLIEIIHDPEPSVREVVIDALGHSHHPEILDILVSATQDIASVVRRTAVIGLGMQAKGCPPSSISILLKSLELLLWDLDTEVRRQTAIALGRIQTAESAHLLFTALIAEDFPTPVKADVVRALIWTNTQAGLDSLNRYLVDHHPKASIYQEIVIMLGRVETPQLYQQATHILLNLLEHHGITQQSDIIKQSIAMSLGQLKQPEAEAALQTLSQDEDERVSLHAIAALKTLRNAWES